MSSHTHFAEMYVQLEENKKSSGRKRRDLKNGVWLAEEAFRLFVCWREPNEGSTTCALRFRVLDTSSPSQSGHLPATHHRRQQQHHQIPLPPSGGLEMVGQCERPSGAALCGPLTPAWPPSLKVQCAKFDSFFFSNKSQSTSKFIDITPFLHQMKLSQNYFFLKMYSHSQCCWNYPRKLIQLLMSHSKSNIFFTYKNILL